MCKNTRRVYHLVEKARILSKSNCKCAHCGKVLDVSTMTLDHVIPVSRKLDNEEENLVALCDTCNKSKGSLLTDPNIYFPYVKEDVRKQLNDAYIAFLQNDSNLTLKNALGVGYCTVNPESIEEYKKKRHANWNENPIARDKRLFEKQKLEAECKRFKSFIFRQAYSQEEMDRIRSFYVTGSNVKEEKARHFINEMFRSSSVYYIEDQHGDILFCCGINLRRYNGSIFLSVYNILVKYASLTDFISCFLLYGVMRPLIVNLNKGDELPVIFTYKKDDWLNSGANLDLLKALSESSGSCNSSDSKPSLYTNQYLEGIVGVVTKDGEYKGCTCRVTACLDYNSAVQKWLWNLYPAKSLVMSKKRARKKN